MFTGLIEAKGKVKTIDLTQNGAKISISAPFSDVQIGESISINGACQSVTHFDGSSFTVDSMNETLRLTNLKNLKVGDFVNLERALTLSSRLGGHYVTGHIDTTSKLIQKRRDGISNIYKFECNNTKYIVLKGSICVNGISLTVSNVADNYFEVSVIPITESETNISNLKMGDIVNIEFDILAKYVEKLLNKEKKLDVDFLKECGF